MRGRGWGSKLPNIRAKRNRKYLISKAADVSSIIWQFARKALIYRTCIKDS